MRRLLAILTLTAALSSISCTALRVHISKTAPPDFTFSAGQFVECCDYFYGFLVFEEGSEAPIWEIVTERPVERREAGVFTIHYGKIPDRFQQKIPASGQPPPLIEGKRYEAVAHGDYAPGARVRFVVENNKIIELPEQPGDNP